MNPLVSKRVQRGQVLQEWVSAADHLTDEGRHAFAQRMKGYGKPQVKNVRAITEKRKA